MKKITNSTLYQYLGFLRNIKTEYNVKEIFNLMLGYQLAINQKTIALENREEWIIDFNIYIEEFLLNKFYFNKMEKLPRNYGDIIFENQQNDFDGLKQFFQILDLFVKSQEDGKWSNS